MQATSRERRSDATRRAILTAARERFAEDGYDRATIRAIAADAGIDPSMVMRYFGSKERLFALAADFDLRLPDLTGTPRDQIGRRIAGHVIDRWDGDETLMALLRAAVTHPAAAERMREIFATQLQPALAAFTPAPPDAAAPVSGTAPEHDAPSADETPPRSDAPPGDAASSEETAPAEGAASENDAFPAATPASGETMAPGPSVSPGAPASSGVPASSDSAASPGAPGALDAPGSPHAPASSGAGSSGGAASSGAGPSGGGVSSGDVAFRAGLVAAQVLGLALTRYVLRLPPVAAMDRDAVVAWIGPTLQRYITGEAGPEGR